MRRAGLGGETDLLAGLSVDPDHDAAGLPRGTYLYQLTAGAFSQTKAMALLK